MDLRGSGSADASGTFLLCRDFCFWKAPKILFWPPNLMVMLGLQAQQGERMMVDALSGWQEERKSWIGSCEDLLDYVQPGNR